MSGLCLLGVCVQKQQSTWKQKASSWIVESFEEITNNVYDLCVNHAELSITLVIMLLFTYGVFFVTKRRLGWYNKSPTTATNTNNCQTSSTRNLNNTTQSDSPSAHHRTRCRACKMFGHKLANCPKIKVTV